MLFPAAAAFSRRPVALGAPIGTLTAGDAYMVVSRSDSLTKALSPMWIDTTQFPTAARNVWYSGDADTVLHPSSNFSLVSVGPATYGSTSKGGSTANYTLTDDFATSDSFEYTISDGTNQATGTIYITIVATNDDAVVTFGNDVSDMFRYPRANFQVAKFALPNNGGTIRVSYGQYDNSYLLFNNHANFHVTIEGVRSAQDERPYLTNGGVVVSIGYVGSLTLRGLEIANCGQWVSLSQTLEKPGYAFNVDDCVMHDAANNGIHGNHYGLVTTLTNSEFYRAGVGGNTTHIFYSAGDSLTVTGCTFHSCRGGELLKNRYRVFHVENCVFEATREPNPETTVYICTDMINFHNARGVIKGCEFILYPRNNGTRGNSAISQRNSMGWPTHNTNNPHYYPMHGSSQDYVDRTEPPEFAFPVAEGDPRYSWPDGDPGSTAYWDAAYWSAARAHGFTPADMNPYINPVWVENCTIRVRNDFIADQHQYCRAFEEQGYHPAWRPRQFRLDLSFPVDRPMGWFPPNKIYVMNTTVLGFQDPSQHMTHDFVHLYGFDTLAECVGPYYEDPPGELHYLVGHEPKFNQAEPDPFQSTSVVAKPGDTATTPWTSIIGPTIDWSAGGNNDDKDPADPTAYFGNNNATVSAPAWWGYNATNPDNEYWSFPRFASAAVIDSDTIRITFQEQDLDTTGPIDSADFTYKTNGGAPQTVTTATIDSATQVTLTGLQVAISTGETITVSFTGANRTTPMRGSFVSSGTGDTLIGNSAKPFTDEPVTNGL